MALAPKQTQVIDSMTEEGKRLLTDNSPLAVVALRNLMAKTVWESNKRIMCIAELCITDERIWKIARSQMLDEFNLTEKEYKKLINTLLITGEEEQNGTGSDTY